MRASVPVLLVLAACVPELSSDESLVDAPRLLAVRAEPAEVRPGQKAQLTALFVDAAGTVVAPPIDWHLCRERLPLAELGPVSLRCFDPDADRVALGQGESVEATASQDACRLFGPNPPPALPGEPAGRAVDADLTGGFAQPVVVSGDEGVSVAALRLTCGFAGVTQAQSAELNRRRRANENPFVDSFRLVVEGQTHEVGGDVIEVPASAPVSLEVGWPSCPEKAFCGDGVCDVDDTVESCADECRTLVRCQGAERYVMWDPVAREIVVRREKLRVSWYASAGAFEREREVIEGEGTRASNVWQAPGQGAATVWVVLRDDRGGVAWRQVRVAVGPLR